MGRSAVLERLASGFERQLNLAMVMALVPDHVLEKEQWMIPMPAS
jgi:hypothetical protein